MRKETKAQREELRAIAATHKGLLRPKDIVDFARNPATALHARFCWDNTRAAELYRLWQAQQTIRVWVEVINEYREPVRAFVSVMDDRIAQGGGYRTLSNVLSDSLMRRRFLRQALDSLKEWERRYQQLKELAPIFAARARLSKKIR